MGEIDMLDKQNDLVNANLRTRRRWSKQEKLEIVIQTYAAGQSVHQVAACHQINPNLIFLWRKQYEQGDIRPALPGEKSVPAFLLGDALKRLRDMQQLLEKKTKEAEVQRLIRRWDQEARTRIMLQGKKADVFSR